MNVHSSSDVFTSIPDSGMARFLSPINLRRYRRLAAQTTNAAERNRLFKLLSREWVAFLDECHSSSLEDIVWHRPDRKMTPGSRNFDVGVH
jgi:hypothetical protein